jgi:hypothetical protein
MNWQKIETAPKDGTPILVYDKDWFDFMGHQIVVYWLEDFGWRSGCDQCPDDPTHWMPLPEPPKEG